MFSKFKTRIRNKSKIIFEIKMLRKLTTKTFNTT